MGPPWPAWRWFAALGRAAPGQRTSCMNRSNSGAVLLRPRCWLEAYRSQKWMVLSSQVSRTHSKARMPLSGDAIRDRAWAVMPTQSSSTRFCSSGFTTRVLLHTTFLAPDFLMAQLTARPIRRPGACKPLCCGLPPRRARSDAASMAQVLETEVLKPDALATTCTFADSLVMVCAAEGGALWWVLRLGFELLCAGAALLDARGVDLGASRDRTRCQTQVSGSRSCVCSATPASQWNGPPAPPPWPQRAPPSVPAPPSPPRCVGGGGPAGAAGGLPCSLPALGYWGTLPTGRLRPRHASGLPCKGRRECKLPAHQGRGVSWRTAACRAMATWPRAGSPRVHGLLIARRRPLRRSFGWLREPQPIHTPIMQLTQAPSLVQVIAGSRRPQQCRKRRMSPI